MQRQPDVLVFTKRSGCGGVERIAARLTAGWRAEGMHVVDVRSPASRPLPEWLEMMLLFIATRRRTTRERPRLLFCPGNAYAVVAVALKLMLGRRCPPIVLKISNDLRRPDLPLFGQVLYRVWLKVQGRTIDVFAALSAPMATEIVERMGVPAGRVGIVPNPVLSRADIAEDERRSPPPRSEGRRFVAVGRLERQKDHAMMLRAFARARQDGDTLTILGEGRERTALERLAATLGIASHVTLPGHSGAVRELLAQHDVLLLSSIYEGQPGSVVEALSVGLNVIATRCCTGVAGLLDDGALGCLVPSGDEAAFATAIAAARPGARDRARARAKAMGCTIEAALPVYAAVFARARRRSGRRLSRRLRLATASR